VVVVGEELALPDELVPLSSRIWSPMMPTTTARKTSTAARAELENA
jgi:hypothetical protein